MKIICCLKYFSGSRGNTAREDRKQFIPASRKPFSIILFLTISLFLFILSPADLKASDIDNTLIYLSPVDVITFNPGLVTDRYSSEIIANIFEGLVRYKQDSPDIEPCLAVSWKSYNNGKRWVFKLRKGVKFHDGEPFSASSVVNSFAEKLGKKDKYKEWNTFYTYLDNVSVFGTHTVQFLLSEPYAPFLFQLASPKSAIVGTSSLEGRVPYPVGTGPFSFGERKTGKYVKLLRNDNYWSNNAKLDAVIIKVVKDQKWRLLQMKNNKADVALLESGYDVGETVNRGDLKIVSGISASTHFIAFNLKKGPFRDKNLRYAISYMINKDSIIKKIFQGFAETATSPVPPGVFGYKPDLDRRLYDIEEAKRLKKKANFNSNEDVSLYYSNNSKNLESIAGVLVRAGRKIGINIKRKPIPFSELELIGYDTHDMLMLGWVGDIPDADVYLYPNFTEKTGRLNRSGYLNPELTGILEKARMTNNRKERKRLYFTAQEIINRDLPWLPLYHLKNILLVNKNVFGVKIQPLSFLNFRNVHIVRE